jgi:hypothetical protein
MMKEIWNLLKVTKEDTFSIAVVKRVVRGYLKVGLGGLMIFVKLTSNKEEVQKFKEELGV